jgi:hypothetical protein
MAIFGYCMAFNGILKKTSKDLRRFAPPKYRYKALSLYQIGLEASEFGTNVRLRKLNRYP